MLNCGRNQYWYPWNFFLSSLKLRKKVFLHRKQTFLSFFHVWWVDFSTWEKWSLKNDTQSIVLENRVRWGSNNNSWMQFSVADRKFSFFANWWKVFLDPPTFSKILKNSSDFLRKNFGDFFWKIFFLFWLRGFPGFPMTRSKFLPYRRFDGHSATLMQFIFWH